MQKRLELREPLTWRSHSVATPWAVVYQDPLSMEFSRQVYWSGLPFPSPRVLPDLRIKPISYIGGRRFTIGAAREAQESEVDQSGFLDSSDGKESACNSGDLT